MATKTASIRMKTSAKFPAATKPAAPAKPSKPVIGEYSGNPLLILNSESRFPFQFGLAKAKLIVEHFAAIKRFAESEGKTV